MLGLDVLTLGGLSVLAAGSLCQIPKPADISIVPTAAAVKYDTSQTTAQIQSQNIDTINPYGFNNLTHTNGYMVGTISMKPYASIGYHQLGAQDAYCLWYEKIKIEISIAPTIVIPSEVAADQCMLAAVQEHELKHVMVDRKIVNKYAKIMGQKVFDGLNQRGFVAGPFASKDVQSVADRMRKTVNQLIDLEYKKMQIERQERQQAVDNIDEYERVSAQCPDYKSSF